MRRDEASGDTLHEQILSIWNETKQAWAPIHSAYTEDQKFADGEQWDAAVEKARVAANLSVLVYNQVPAKYRYVVNNFRRNVPGVKIYPISDGANKNTARVLNGIVKQIATACNASQAYVHALTCATIGGIGAWKILPVRGMDGEYAIEIQRILDPTTVFVDPNSQRQDFSDAKFCFLSFWISKGQYEAEYGKEDEASELGEATRGMFTKNSVQLLEYWCLNEDTGFWEQYIVSGSRVLRENKAYRGRFMPVAVVTGEERHVDGERAYKGIVRDIKDMQILLNLAKSKTADYIARSSNQQWLVESAQIEGFEDIWLSSNINGIPVLPFNATAAGAPQRLDAPAPPAGFMQVAQDADNDIRQSVGIRDPLESMPSNVASKTVEMQISQSNTGTYEFIDRIKDMIRYTNRVILDLIPYYFGYPHMREIMGIDDQVSTIPVNVQYMDNGETIFHDLTTGKYGVAISDGPSYESQRSEAADKLMECAKVYPQFMQLAGDIVFRNMDFDGASEIADRLRAQIPPEILAASNPTNGDGSNGNRAAIMQAQLGQASQMIQQLQAQVAQLQAQNQALSMDIKTETTKTQVKLHADLALEAARARNQRELAGQNQQGKESIQRVGIEADRQSDLLKNHTDIFVAEIKHGADQIAQQSAPIVESIIPQESA